jgi:flagellar basal body-associated protein FliL
MSKKMVVILIIIVVIVISFGLYTILPYFTNTVVDEPLPTASGLNLKVVNFYNFLDLIVSRNS